MDYYRFINSKDVRAHLEKIGYQFSPLEAACVVYQCVTATMEEKHAAWREIIETMPDTAIDLKKWEAPRESLHAFLRDYIALEERLLAEFYAPGDRSFWNYYAPEYYEAGLMVDHRGIFYDLDDCLEAALAYRDEPKLYLYRMDLMTGNRLRVAFDRDRQPLAPEAEYTLWISDERLLEGSFPKIRDPFPFPIPLPFRQGDVLWECRSIDGGMSCITAYGGPGYAVESSDLNKETVIDASALRRVPQHVIKESFEILSKDCDLFYDDDDLYYDDDDPPF